MEDILEIAGKKIKNRLFIGTGKFASYEIMKEALEAAEAEVVTVALRRVDTGTKAENILDYILTLKKWRGSRCMHLALFFLPKISISPSCTSGSIIIKIKINGRPKA